MFTVHKYVISPYGAKIEMPANAEILTVAYQGNDCCIWAKVDTEAEPETRQFELFGTGHRIPRVMGVDYIYIGTGFINGLVFHAFEISN